MDKLPQVPADRATQVVPLAAVTIAAIVGLAFAGAAWGVYALVVGILVVTTVALKAWVLWIKMGDSQAAQDHRLKVIKALDLPGD